MAQDIEVKVVVNSSQATAGIDKLGQSLKQTKQSVDDVSNSGKDLSKLESGINSVGGAIGQFNPALGKTVQGLNGVILKMWEFVANPIGAIIAAIVIGLKFLYEAFQSSVAGGKELKAVFASVTAVGEQIKDAIFGLGRAFIDLSVAAYKFITLDFKGAAESMKSANKEASESYKQLGNAVDGTTAKIIYNNAKMQQANDKARKLQSVVQSETNKLLVKSREILTDETASIKDKKKALEEVTTAEKASSAEKVRIAALDLKLGQERAKALGGEAEKKAKQELRDLTISLNEAETENAMTGIKLNKQRKMLLRQETADAKEAADAIKAANKEKTDAENAAIKVKKDNLKIAQDAEKEAVTKSLENSLLSFQQKRDLVNADANLSVKDKQDFIDKINKDEKTAIENHKKELAGLENRYKTDIENLNAKTDQQKLDLQKSRDEAELLRIATTKEEQETLKLSLDQKYKILQDELDAKKLKEKQDKEAELNLSKANNQQLDFETRLLAVQAREDAEKNISFKTEEEKTAYEKANSDARIAIANEEKNAKLKAFASTAETLSGLADLLGTETEAGKAAAVASATISTFLSAQKAYESTVGIPFVGPVLAPINAGLAIAGGLKSIKSILAVKTPKGGGGGSAPSISAPSTATPNPNVVSASSSNQLASTLSTQPPIKAFVVANDVTTQQNLNMNIVKTATLG